MGPPFSFAYLPSPRMPRIRSTTACSWSAAATSEVEDLFDRPPGRLRDLADEPLNEPGRIEGEVSRLEAVLEDRRDLGGKGGHLATLERRLHRAMH